MPARPLIAACLTAFPLLTAIAAGHTEHHHAGELAAHQHGVGGLNVAVDGQLLEIELSGPADNFLGFEHAPVGQTELAQARLTLSTLRQPAELFQLPIEARCESISVQVHSELLENVGSDRLPSAEHEHEHEHEQEHHAQAPAHQDIAAHYRFRCENIEALDRVELKLFQRFPNTQRLKVQSAGISHQLGGEVTAGQPVLSL